MKRFVPLLILLILISVVLCIPASAAFVENDAYDYPSFQTVENMKKKMPSQVTVDGVTYNFDNAVIVFDDSGSIKCYLWDYDYCHMRVANSEKALYTYGAGSGDDAFTMATWDSKGYWSGVKTYSCNPDGASHYYALPVAENGLIYTKNELLNESSVAVATAGSTYGVVTPDWKTLTWDNTFKDLPKKMMSEITGILPVLLVVLVGFLAIRKGIAFLLSILKSS